MSYNSKRTGQEIDNLLDKIANIQFNRTYVLKASGYGVSWTAPPSGISTPGNSIALEAGQITKGLLNDGDTVILQVPNTLTSSSTYPLHLQLDPTLGTSKGNIIPLFRGQSAGTPVQWVSSTSVTNGYYIFVYSVKTGGLIYITRNTATSG